MTTTTGKIVLKGPFAPPTGILGPHARRTKSHVYQIFNASGIKLVGGSFGADTNAALEYAKKIAAQKGLLNPAIKLVTGDA
jgi:hypothetical protein